MKCEQPLNWLEAVELPLAMEILSVARSTRYWACGGRVERLDGRPEWERQKIRQL